MSGKNTWRKYLDEEFLNELDKSKDDGFYSGEYIELDPIGYKEVRCMRCEELIAQREKNDDNRYVLKPFPIYTQVQKKLNDGTTAGFLLCSSCAPIVEKTSDENKRLIAVAQAGWVQELVHAKKDELVILAYMEKKKGLEIINGLPE